MKKNEPIWSIKDTYDGAENLIIVFGVMSTYNVSNGKPISIDDLDQYQINVDELTNYEDGEPILLFEAIEDSAQTSNSVTKDPGLWIHDNCCYTHLILIHPETNGSRKKIKKTGENVSNIKPNES
jgi:hypothetical protein